MGFRATLPVRENLVEQKLPKNVEDTILGLKAKLP